MSVNGYGSVSCVSTAVRAHFSVCYKIIQAGNVVWRLTSQLALRVSRVVSCVSAQITGPCVIVSQPTEKPWEATQQLVRCSMQCRTR